MKWAAVRALQFCWHFRRICSVARIRGLEDLSCLDTWGLHPRLYAYACMDRGHGGRMFGDMVDTFPVIPSDRKESQVCLGELLPPCHNVTSSCYWPVTNKPMCGNYAGNLRSVRPRPISGWRDFKQTG